MKYIVRSIKYFFYLLIILALVITALVLFKVVEGDLSTLFVNGYDSFWQIGLVALFFALVYPKVGFATRKARMLGEPAQTAPIVKEVLRDRGYELETAEGDDMTFRKRSGFDRMLKMWEDRVTFEKTPTGYDVEGLTKEIVRLISAVEAKGGVEF